jgi:uncharacterized hydrophobic protein (TIGR00271 family)
MRLVRVLVPDDRYARVAESLRAEEFEVITSKAYDVEESSGAWLLEVPVPNAAVETVFDVLSEAEVSDEAYTVVESTEAVASPKSERLRNRYAGDYAPLTWEEFRAKAHDLTNDWVSYTGLMVLSALIATAALLMDSAAVLVGSMVIAPLVSPVITTSVGAITGDRSMLVSSLLRQLAGVVVGVVVATLFAFALRTSPVVPVPLNVTAIELMSVRLAPGVPALAVGAAAGAAAAFAFVTRGTTELVGVMVAAALVPAAAAAGIGIAWGEPAVVLGTLALLLVTLVLINGLMIGTLVVLGYRPHGEVDVLSRGPALLTIGVTLLVVVAAVAGVGGHVAFATDAKRTVGDVVDGPAYDGVEVVSVGVQYAGPFADAPASVSVVLSRPASASLDESRLASRLAERVSAETGRTTTVDLEFQNYYQSTSAPNGTSAERGAFSSAGASKVI